MFGLKLFKQPSTAAPEPAGASLELLYRQHYGWLLGMIRKRFGPDQAEDIAQDTYLRAATYQGKAVRNPRALLLHIATNVAIDRDRRRISKPVVFGLTEEETHSPETQEQALALKQLILRLPPHLREVFVLSRFGALTYEEISEHLGIAAKTVEWRMTKALKQLSRDLDRDSRS